MERPIHFEIDAMDPDKLAHFYEAVFGWKATKWGGPVEYWLVKTGDGERGIDGGFMRRDPAKPMGTVNTIGVDDIHRSREKLVAAGGRLATDVSEIPGIGYFCYALDSEGNMFGMMQAT